MDTEEVPPAEAQHVLRRVCDLTRYGDPKLRFPGTQPVTMGRKDLAQLRARPYVVCEKTDGVRYLLFTLGGAPAYLIDRNAHVLRWRRRLHLQRVAVRNAAEQATLLDGELVGPTFIVFDAVSVVGRDVSLLPLDVRLTYALEGVVALNDEVPAGLSMKDFFKLSDVSFLWREVCPRLPHECDGLIFTPLEDPYKVGTSHTLLKWKPCDLNTVDFKLDPIESSAQSPAVKLLVLEDHQLTLFGWLAANEQPQHGVFECRWDPQARTFLLNEDRWEDGGWRVLRRRTDKDFPNTLRTATRVLGSIHEGLGFEEIEAAVKRR